MDKPLTQRCQLTLFIVVKNADFIVLDAPSGWRSSARRPCKEVPGDITFAALAYNAPLGLDIWQLLHELIF
jgi:hypothetical protein